MKHLLSNGRACVAQARQIPVNAALYGRFVLITYRWVFLLLWRGTLRAYVALARWGRYACQPITLRWVGWPAQEGKRP